jgi:hypothetical protein
LAPLTHARREQRLDRDGRFAASPELHSRIVRVQRRYVDTPVAIRDGNVTAAAHPGSHAPARPLRGETLRAKHRSDLKILTDAADQLAGMAPRWTGSSKRPKPLPALVGLLRWPVEDVLVAFVFDCERCGRRVHWVPGDGCALGHWAHAEPAPDDHQPRLSRDLR